VNSSQGTFFVALVIAIPHEMWYCCNENQGGEKMKKNRVLPFGYCMQNGEIIMQPEESEAVKQIFISYINGESLSSIADMMTDNNIYYHECSKKWNKNMVKRILENEKYLGTDDYSPIVSQEDFSLANAKKQKKSTKVCVISDELNIIRERTFCKECGKRLIRIGGNNRSDKWDCRNIECSRLEYRLTDNMLIGTVLNVLNTVIANQDLINIQPTENTYQPDMTITRQQNEIDRLMENPVVNYESAKAEIIKLAQLKYDCCNYDDSSKKTGHLLAIISEREQLNTLDIDLYKSTVSRVYVSHFNFIEVEFINGKIIKNTYERSYNNDSTKC